jgi:hypothetical protein
MDHKYIAGVIVEITNHGNYRVAFQAGVYKCVLHRGQFKVDANKTPALYNLTHALEHWKTMKKVSVREALRKVSMLGGQGAAKCGCAGKCNTKSCSCYKKGLKCNSRCHAGNTKCCTNK